MSAVEKLLSTLTAFLCILMYMGCAVLIEKAGGGYLIQGVFAIAYMLTILLGRQYHLYYKQNRE